LFNIAEDGVCVIPITNGGDGFGDLDEIGQQLADFYNIESTTLAWIITIVLSIVGIGLIKRLIK